jgi:hypothetical protein
MDKYSKTGKRIILCYLPRKFYLEGAFVVSACASINSHIV